MLGAVGGRILLLRSLGILIFMRLAGDIATCMYYTGLDPFTKQKVYVAQHLRDRKLQRALMQFFRPENYFLVREALLQAGGRISSARASLVGSRLSHRRRPLRRAGVRPMTRTITTASPTRPRARSLGSGACRIRATGRGGSRPSGGRGSSANGMAGARARDRCQRLTPGRRL